MLMIMQNSVCIFRVEILGWWETQGRVALNDESMFHAFGFSCHIGQRGFCSPLKGLA